MTGPFVVVEQIGDITVQVAGHTYDHFGVAMLALVDLTAGCDDEREFYIDGPDLDHPIGVGRQRPAAD